MATERTRRLINTGNAAARMNAAERARSRLYVEGKKLLRGITEAQKRLKEIDEEEEVLSATIDECGAIIAEANAGPEAEPETEQPEPSEAEVSGVHR